MAIKIEDETIIINNNKVYSSYYGRACKILPNRRMVAISLKVPDYFEGEIIRELNPTESLFLDYKNGTINEIEYEKRYKQETLDKLNTKEIYNKLKGKVIICHCGKDKFCHRQLVINWLKTNLGEGVTGGEI